MSDHPHGPDWHQDQEGRWHPPEARPLPGSGGPLSPGVTAATRASLLAGAATGGVAATALAVEAGRFDPAAVRSAPDVTAALGTAGTWFAVWSLAAVLGSVMLMVWLFRAHRAAASLGPTGLTWSPGWAIGGWLVPLGNFVIPRLVAGEIDRLSNPDAGPPPIGDRWRGLPTLASGHWWWALTIAGGIVFVLGFGAVLEQIDAMGFAERTYRAGLRATAAGLALWSGGSAAGALMVGRIGARLTDARRGGPTGP